MKSLNATKTDSGMRYLRLCICRSALACFGMAAAIGAWLTTPVAAQTLTYTNAALGYGYFTVNILYPTTISGGAGLIVLTTPSGDIQSWCVDVYDFLQTSGTFAIGPLTNDSAPISAGGPNPLSDAQIGQIGALVLNGDTLVNAPPSGYSANDVGAAIQLAIWQVEYPAFSYSWDPAEANADALAAIYYGDAIAGSGEWSAYYGIAALSEFNNQTQVVDPSGVSWFPQGPPLPAPVPELSTWALMLIGALALAAASSVGRRWTVATRSGLGR
jgi:hypothetical protein